MLAANAALGDRGFQATRSESGTCTRLRVENVEFHALGRVQVNNPGVSVLEPPHTGLAAYGLVGLDVFDCRFTSDVVPGLSNPLVLGSEEVRVHRCTLIVELDDEGHALTPGGIHVRSCSRDVEILGCRIEGGWGHGIALGHVIEVERSEDLVAIDVFGANIDANTLEPLGQLQINEYDGCGPAPDDLVLTAPDPTETVWLPAGPLEDLRIHDNVIRGMGLSGISTAVFLPASFDWDNDGFVDDVPRFIVTAEVEIARNVIEANVQNPHLNVLGFQNFDVAVGGVVLAASVNAWIHDNTIRDNGSVGYVVPICGIGLLAARNAVIEDNRIVDNGASHPGGPDLLRALRGGIAIYEATPALSTEDGQLHFPTTIANITLPGTQKSYLAVAPQPAVIVRGNEVSQPVGKALWVRRGFGAVTVTGNSFLGFGDPVDGVAIVGASFCWKYDGKALPLPARGVCVEILDYGYSTERSWDEGTEFELPRWYDATAIPVAGGVVSFCGNTVTLDWVRVGGDGVTCLLSSNDAVVANSNVVRTTMHSTYAPGNPALAMPEFYGDVLTEFAQSSFLFAGMYAGASSTVQVSMNRMIEGKFDGLFSIISGMAVAPTSPLLSDVSFANVRTSNVCSHASSGTTPFSADSDNATTYPATLTLSTDVLDAPGTRVVCVAGA
jgi:hypothetical protein